MLEATWLLMSRGICYKDPSRIDSKDSSSLHAHNLWASRATTISPTQLENNMTKTPTRAYEEGTISQSLVVQTGARTISPSPPLLSDANQWRM